MRLLTVEEAAKELGISRALVYSLCATKRIRHERHGLGRGTIRIPEDAITEYRQGVTVEMSLVEHRPVKPRKYRHLT